MDVIKNIDDIVAELEEFRAHLIRADGDQGADDAGVVEDSVRALKEMRARRIEKYGYGIKPDSSWGGVNGPVGGTKPWRGVPDKVPVSENNYVTDPRQPVGGNTDAGGKISKSLDAVVNDPKLTPGEKVHRWVTVLMGGNEGELVTSKRGGEF